jgi:hypothetical protein
MKTLYPFELRYFSAPTLAHLAAHCETIRERCRQQRASCAMLKVAMQMSRALRTVEEQMYKERRQKAEIDRMAGRLIESVYEDSH